MLLLVIFVVLASPIISINNVQSANILCLTGFPSASHHIWNKSIMKALADRGNNLTILTTIEAEQSTENMHYIHMENVFAAIIEHYSAEMDTTDFVTTNVYNTIVQMYDYYSVIDRALIKSDGIKILRNYPKDFKFDVVLHDFTNAQILLGFVDQFGYPPLVSVSPFGIPSYTHAVSSLPIFPSYMPHIAGPFTNRMIMRERIQNFSYHLIDWIYRYFIYMGNANKKARQFFGENLPKLQSIEKTTDLVLVNVDFSIDYPQLLPPNVIPVGGLQVKRSTSMDASLQQYLDESTDGFVFFSLGTMVQSEFLGKTNEILMEAFRSLKKYRFVWKYDGHDLENVPTNVLIGKFFPQNSILAHPNIKLFITHCGLLSMQESIWHGVPMLGIPVFMDQQQNAAKMVGLGIGEQIDYRNVTRKNVIEVIEKIIQQSSYIENVKQRSKRFQNQPMHPLDRAVHWIEAVIKNNGTKHLQLANQDMYFVQIYMLDVIAILLFITFTFLYIISRHMHLRRKDGIISAAAAAAVAKDISKTTKIE